MTKFLSAVLVVLSLSLFGAPVASAFEDSPAAAAQDGDKGKKKGGKKKHKKGKKKGKKGKKKQGKKKAAKKQARKKNQKK